MDERCAKPAFPLPKPWEFASKPNPRQPDRPFSRRSSHLRYNKYCVLRQFFCYWKARNEIYSLPLPPPRRFPVQTFVPYVFSRTELRRLLVAAGITQRDLNSVIGPRTFRTLLLFLYTTGAG